MLKSYLHEGNGIKDMIECISVDYIDEIIDKEYLIPFELLSKLFDKSEITMDTKKKLVLRELPNMNEVLAKKCLQSLNLIDFLSLFEGKRPKFEANNTNKQMLDIFKEKEWISSYDIDKNDSSNYRAFGRRINNSRV